MSDHNVFRFRRLKWGAPKRLEGLKAIERDGNPGAPVTGPRRGVGLGTLGLWVVVVAVACAIGMSLLGG